MKLTMQKPIIALVSLSLLYLGGCGYTTKAFFLPEHITSIYIAPLENNTDEPNIAQDLRTELIAAFQNDGNLKIESRENQAGAVLKGTLTGYRRQALRYEDDETVREYRLTVTVDFVCIDRLNNANIVEESGFSGDTSFYLSGSLAKTESEAKVEALQDLARRIINRITTLW